MDQSEPATMIATRIVPVGDAEPFCRWADAMTRSAAAARGSTGSLRLEQAGGLVHLVHGFEDEAALSAWTRSSGYRSLLAEGERFPVERRTTILGREASATVPAESAASKLKTALLTWVTVFPVLLVVSTAVRALLGGWPQPLQLLLSSLLMVAALSWVIMPWVQRRARPWTLADADGRARAWRLRVIAECDSLPPGRLPGADGVGGGDMVTMTTLAKADEPDGAPRIAGLDVLRGIAILGILFMNIPDMGQSIWHMMSGDPKDLGWTLADRVAWFGREIYASGTARCLLEMLFGAGMVILTDRAARAAASRWAVLRAYWWRNLVLFLFGVVHVLVLLWPGDILHTYGIAAMVVVLFRRLRPGWMLALGLTMALLQLGGGGFGYYEATTTRARAAAIEVKQAAGQPVTAAERKTLADLQKRRADRAESRAETKAKISADDRARAAATGDIGTWAGSAWSQSWWFVSQGLELLFIWEAAATMLVGAALFRWGVLQGQRSRRFYAGLTLVGYAIGLGSRAIGAVDQAGPGDGPSIIWSLGEVARLATTLGHVGLVYLLLGTVAGARLLKPFEAAGRTALTIYILQTIACLWLLYPPFALGLYGKQGWAALMLTALLVDAGLLLLANWYVRRFNVAPVEWAWRSLVERRMLSFGRKAAKPMMGDALPA